MGKNPYAVELAKRAVAKGAPSKGGKARARKLSAERRKEIAKKAVRARWKKAGSAVNQLIDRLLSELKEALHGTYGDDLRGLYLYGSYARGEEIADSDVDVIIVLESIGSYGAEIERTGAIISSLSLKYGVSISRIFVSQRDWSQRSSSFLASLGDEAIPA